LCDKAGLVKLGHVAIDGTKLKANAGKDHRRSLPVSLSWIRPPWFCANGQR
jgi:hypothetical protein